MGQGFFSICIPWTSSLRHRSEERDETSFKQGQIFFVRLPMEMEEEGEKHPIFSKRVWNVALTRNVSAHPSRWIYLFVLLLSAPLSNSVDHQTKDMEEKWWGLFYENYEKKCMISWEKTTALHHRLSEPFPASRFSAVIGHFCTCLEKNHWNK